MRFKDIGTEELTWWDCWSIIYVEVTTNGSPLNRKHDEHWIWHSPYFDMLVNVFDILRAIQAFTPRQKGMKQPKQTPRPWERTQHGDAIATTEFLEMADITDEIKFEVIPHEKS